MRDQILDRAPRARRPASATARSLADPERDLAKIAVVERHHATGRIGLGLVRGFGLRRGAVATTVAHDAHNIVAVGCPDDDLARCVERLAELGGGIAIYEDGELRAELALPVAGLMSEEPAEQSWSSASTSCTPSCASSARRSPRRS